jgi:hypothetical protein
MSNLPRHCKHLENAVVFSAVSELSGSFRKRQRFGKELWINALNLTKRLNGLNVLNSRVVNQSSLLRFIQRFPGATTEG